MQMDTLPVLCSEIPFKTVSWSISRAHLICAFSVRVTASLPDVQCLQSPSVIRFLFHLFQLQGQIRSLLLHHGTCPHAQLICVC